MKKGFVLAEIIVVMGILATLFGIVYIRATNIARRAPLPPLINNLVTDIKGQQTKAMNGQTVAGALEPFGVHFETTRYVLFSGASFNPADTANIAFDFPDTVTLISATFPDATILFAQGSGEIVGYSNLTNTVTIGESGTGRQIIFTLNQYGTITSSE